MEKKYPRLDRPIQEWTWDDVKAEIKRFGTDEIDEYVTACGCSPTGTPEEFNRRATVFNHALTDESISDELYKAHMLKVKKQFRDVRQKKFDAIR